MQVSGDYHFSSTSAKYRLYRAVGRAVRPVAVREANRPRRPRRPRRPAADGGEGGNPDADWVRGSRPPDGIRRLHAHQSAGEVCERLEALCHAAPRPAPRRSPLLARMCNTFGVASHDPHSIVYIHAVLLHQAARGASTVNFRVRPWVRRSSRGEQSTSHGTRPVTRHLRLVCGWLEQNTHVSNVTALHPQPTCTASHICYPAVRFVPERNHVR